MRNYTNIQVLAWIDDFSFVGTVDYRNPNYPNSNHTAACYGWSKGGSFFVYTIKHGHLSRIGTIKRHVVLDDEPVGV